MTDSSGPLAIDAVSETVTEGGAHDTVLHGCVALFSLSDQTLPDISSPARKHFLLRVLKAKLCSSPSV